MSKDIIRNLEDINYNYNENKKSNDDGRNKKIIDIFQNNDKNNNIKSLRGSLSKEYSNLNEINIKTIEKTANEENLEVGNKLPSKSKNKKEKPKKIYDSIFYFVGNKSNSLFFLNFLTQGLKLWTQFIRRNNNKYIKILII